MAIAPRSLGTAVVGYLLQQGMDPTQHVLDYTVADKEGVIALTRWDTKVLGPQPTDAQLDAALTAYPTLDRQTRRDKTLWSPQMVALVKALNQRLRNANVDQVTVGAFRTAIEAEYDLLVS